MVKQYLRRRWQLLTCIFLVSVLLGSLGVQVIDRTNQSSQPSIGFGVGSEKVITLGHIAYAAGDVDYTFDGVADNVQFQAALNALPATGGRLVVVSAVQVNFAATVTRAIPNVTIVGASRGTYFTYDGVTALFTAGGNNWVFQDLRTDAGSINMGATTGWQWNNVTINTTYYALRVAESTTGASIDVPTGRTATLVVAAADASAQEKAQADYVADGVADNVEIQAALDSIKLTGGEIRLSPGNYALAAGIVAITTQWMNPVRIIGYGAILTYGAVGGYAFELTGDVTHPYTYFTLEGFSIVGNALGDGGLKLNNLVNHRFKNLQISNFTKAATGYGIRLIDGGVDNSEGNSFSDIILFRNQVGFSSACPNSAANTSLTNIMVILAPANNSRGVDIRNSFSRSLFNNVVVQMGRDDVGNEQIAWYFNAYTMGTVLNAISVDDAGTTPTGGEMIHIDGIKGGLTFVGFQYARAGINTSIFGPGPNDFPVKFYQAAVSGSDTNQLGLSNDANVFPDGTFNGLTAAWTPSAVTLSVDTADKMVGRQSLKFVSNGVTGSAYAYVPDYVRFKNGWVTVSFYYKAAAANDKIQTMMISDGAGGNVSANSFTKDGAWHYMEVRKLVNATAVQLALAFYINTGGVADVDDEMRISGLQVNQGMNGNSFQYSSEVNAIAAGEIRTASGSLTAGNANAIAFAWHNPEAQDIIIKKIVIEVTTGGGTVGSQLDVGIADDATGTNRGTEFFDDLLLNTAQVDDSWVAGDGGTQTKWVFCQDSASATDGWIVGQILTQNAASLVGKYYIEYAGR